jgi:hypothetical protein
VKIVFIKLKNYTAKLAALPEPTARRRRRRQDGVEVSCGVGDGGWPCLRRRRLEPPGVAAAVRAGGKDRGGHLRPRLPRAAQDAEPGARPSGSPHRHQEVQAVQGRGWGLSHRYQGDHGPYLPFTLLPASSVPSPLLRTIYSPNPNAHFGSSCARSTTRTSSSSSMSISTTPTCPSSSRSITLSTTFMSVIMSPVRF